MNIFTPYSLQGFLGYSTVPCFLERNTHIKKRGTFSVYSHFEVFVVTCSDRITKSPRL